MKNQTVSNAALVEAIADYLREELADGDGIGATLKFSYLEGGVVLIDGKVQPRTVSTDDLPADCTVTLSLDTHVAMLRFLLDRAVAFRQGQMTIAGDIAVALRLAPLVSKPFHPPGEEPRP